MQGVIDFTIRFANAATVTNVDAQAQADVTTASAVAETFDPMLLLLLGLFAAFIIALIVLAKTTLSKQSINSNEGTGAVSNKKLTVLSLIVVAIFATFIFMLATKGNALADQLGLVHNNPENVKADNNLLIANVDENGHITVDNATIINDSDLDYLIRQSLIKTTPEFASNDLLNNCNIVVKGCNGVVYDKEPDGTNYMASNVDPIKANSTSTLSFEIQNLDVKSLIDTIDGKDVFKVSLKMVCPNQLNRYKLTVDLKEGHVASQAGVLDSWTKESESVYSKSFFEGADAREIMKQEWKDVVLAYTGMRFDIWEYETYILDKDVNVWATWFSKGALNDYSWSELKTISNDLSVNGESSKYYKQMKEIATYGGCIEVHLKEVASLFLEEDVLNFRIVGICQDDKADGSGKAGLTFMAQNSLAVGYSYRGAPIDEDTVVSGADHAENWAKSGIRKELQPGGTIYDRLPADVQDAMADVSKPYAVAYGNPGSGGTFSNHISYSYDRMFLPSYTELGYVEPKANASNGIHSVPAEGNKYEYMANDKWLTYRDFPDLKQAPRMNNVNFHGFNRLMKDIYKENGLKIWNMNHIMIKNHWVIQQTPMRSTAKSVVPYWGVNNETEVISRSVYPHTMNQIMSFDYTGHFNEYGVSYNADACIAPCFCL